MTMASRMDAEPATSRVREEGHDGFAAHPVGGGRIAHVRIPSTEQSRPNNI